jgi:hypothetical protein
LLETNEANLGFGRPGSQNRNFLLGCAYMHASNSKMALDYLARARIQLEETIERTSRDGSISRDSPIFREQAIIKELMARLST